MDYTIIWIIHIVQVQIMNFAVFDHGFDLFSCDGVGYWQITILGGNTMIQCREDTVGITHLAPFQLKALKGLRTGHFMH
jgi:hypothetical protein